MMRSRPAQKHFRHGSLKRKLTAQEKQQARFDAETERILRRFKKR